jgi:hypothetical protein
MKTTSRDLDWAATKASEALAYLAVNFPEASGSEALHPHQDAAHEAAAAGDAEGYLEALRAWMRAGRDEALRARKEAA